MRVVTEVCATEKAESTPGRWSGSIATSSRMRDATYTWHGMSNQDAMMHQNGNGVFTGGETLPP